MRSRSSIVFLTCTLFTCSIQAASLSPHPKINLNTTSVEQLTHAIKGIGHKRALAIIQYRQKHGLYRTITDLAAVKGIGLRFVQTHRSDLDATFIC